MRGDLSSKNTDAVDAYLKRNSTHADETLRRFYEMKQQGHQVKPVGWVHRQFELMRTEPQRFRRRAASLVAGAALVGGAVFAGTNLPTHTDMPETIAAEPAAVEAEAASALRTMVVRGRILDENGKPLVGATVLEKGSRRGVSTDAAGNYLLRVAPGQRAVLQYAYGGYAEEELSVRAGAVENVTLLPRDKASTTPKKRRWLLF